MKTIGILAVQGAFAAHARALLDVGHEAVLVLSPADLQRRALDGFIFPGGESTVQLDLIGRLDLEAPLRDLIASGLPILATCAGLILLANEVLHPSQRSFGAIDVTVERNGWGRQIESFEATSSEGRELVFIRAPRITRVGAEVEVLDTFEGEPVLVRSGAITCATFHPELTGERELHLFPRGGAGSHMPRRTQRTSSSAGLPSPSP